MQKSKCPFCSSDVVMDEDIYEGDLVDCPNCSSELEVIDLHPLQLTAVEEEEELNSGEEL